jgi:hypothetical protein
MNEKGQVEFEGRMMHHVLADIFAAGIAAIEEREGIGAGDQLRAAIREGRWRGQEHEDGRCVLEVDGMPFVSIATVDIERALAEFDDLKGP